MTTDRRNNINLTFDIVTEYVSKNSVPAGELPNLIVIVHRSFSTLEMPTGSRIEDAKIPAVSVKKSVTNDFIICLEDGRKFKSLKRHLRTRYEMSPEDYREKWGLPSDYPMVAPSYAAARSDLAKKMGLGQSRREKSPPKRRNAKQTSSKSKR